MSSLGVILLDRMEVIFRVITKHLHTPHAHTYKDGQDGRLETTDHIITLTTYKQAHLRSMKIIIQHTFYITHHMI